MSCTMSPLIQARDLSKKYGSSVALDHVNFSVEAGRIVGLIGPNGAGKTSALRAILGLTGYEGQLEVLGREPFGERAALMTEASFIADVAVLPAWLRVDQAIDFVAGVHPRFRRDRALALLAKTQITGKVNDYMDSTRTILITTHQVEEVENLLTDVLFIDRGRIVLDSSLEDIAARYAAVAVPDDRLPEARAAHPFHERGMLGKTMLYFERPDFDRLRSLGEVLTPSISDLFVAKLS
jgi:ABC-2 type transport system ATP-binding protein